MYAYIELSNIARTDSIIQSLSWMSSIPNSSSLSEGWLATGNTNHIVSVTYTSIKSNENISLPDRANFNLRAHRTNVQFVSWNHPYEKLATIDEKGVIFVWVKHENRWSLELINDRNHSVIDMSWSYDGRMTVICYEDSFILVGSVTGQRYWSTILNIPQGNISAVTWLPDISHVILGTTSGQLIIMDHHGDITEILSISKQSIKQLIYSCNKFYPEAPDTNATKFINDDYILACSLENGQILLLNNYQDQSPIIINTNLQNIKMDWSYPSEILLVGGYKYINEMNYINEIIFYTRRGEFLYRINIPQMTQSLSALCWAHGNEIVFVACGTYVYTIWIKHQSIPSMLTICQMKIKENLLKNSLENFNQIFLPNHLKENLLTYYQSIIKGFLPDQKSLYSFLCYPLKSHIRLQCTMKRIDNEKENTILNINSFSGPIYILYLEYLGGLIPLLIAKRISKICPNFIIYNSEIKTNQYLFKPSIRKKNFLLTKSHLNTQIQQLNFNRSNKNSIYVAKTIVNNDEKNLINKKNSSDWNSEDDDENTNNFHDKQSQKKTTNINKLCTIAANIWGTRFKFYSHSNNLPDVLGSVTYKTSFLHLQPRQMTVTVANNYYYIQKRKKLKCTHRMTRDSSVVNSSSISPINLSRSTSLVASMQNFIRPISPPCIQVKEPLSPKFSRASSSIIMMNNDDDSSLLLKTISNIPENCFEPETYRNLSLLNSNQQKKLSLSDPTLNQTKKQKIVKNSKNLNELFSHSSFYQQLSDKNKSIQSDDDEDIESLNSYEEKIPMQNESRKYSSPRHRILTCTNRMKESLSSLDIKEIENKKQSSFYIMQNRPPLWNEQSQVYQLDFGGRVTLESAKNFQIEFKGKQVIQFGRIENNCYTLDFEWPFSPLQAFAVALANITQRLK